MSKELPFFKFFPTEWIMGNISHENYSMQGLFITACCHYWHQECNVNESTLSKILSKRDVKKLKVAKLIKQKGEQICIEFLDEQYTQLLDLHRVRVSNGRKGGLSPAKAQLKPGSSIKDKEEDKEEDKDNITPYSIPPNSNQIDLTDSIKHIEEEKEKLRKKKVNQLIIDMNNAQTYLNAFCKVLRMETGRSIGREEIVSKIALFANDLNDEKLTRSFNKNFDYFKNWYRSRFINNKIKPNGKASNKDLFDGARKAAEELEEYYKDSGNTVQ